MVHHFAPLKNDSVSLKPMGFRTKMFMELFNNNDVFFAFITHLKSPSSLQVENCDSNLRLVKDEGRQW